MNHNQNSIGSLLFSIGMIIGILFYFKMLT